MNPGSNLRLWAPRWLRAKEPACECRRCGTGDVVQSLGQEESLEEEMVTPSSILAWRILWAEELGGLQSMGSQRV